jgi:cytochrome b6-f complex iron-sulfur subunit
MNTCTSESRNGVTGFQTDRRVFCACSLALLAAACGGGGGASAPGAGGGGGTGTVTTSDTKAGLLAQPNGTIRDYATGATSCPDALGTNQGVYLVRDSGGIYAISASCLHLGGRIGPGGNGFACPCHGSTYDLNGKVTGGPAPVGSVLSHFEVKESTPGGVLVIDTAKAVSATTRLN